MVKCRGYLTNETGRNVAVSRRRRVRSCGVMVLEEKNETRQHDMVLYLIEEMQNKELVIV